MCILDVYCRVNVAWYANRIRLSDATMVPHNFDRIMGHQFHEQPDHVVHFDGIRCKNMSALLDY